MLNIAGAGHLLLTLLLFVLIINTVCEPIFPAISPIETYQIPITIQSSVASSVVVMFSYDIDEMNTIEEKVELFCTQNYIDDQNFKSQLIAAAYKGIEENIMTSNNNKRQSLSSYISVFRRTMNLIWEPIEFVFDSSDGEVKRQFHNANVDYSKFGEAIRAKRQLRHIPLTSASGKGPMKRIIDGDNSCIIVRNVLSKSEIKYILQTLEAAKAIVYDDRGNINDEGFYPRFGGSGSLVS